MDLISGFKSELFRPLAILVVPGAFAISPFYLIVAKHNKEILEYSNGNPLGMVGILLIISTAAGLVLENFGSRVERGIDQCVVERYMPKHDDLWSLYLEQKTDSEIVGQRFLRALVTRAKFVFSFLPALVVFLVGFLILHSELNVWTWTSVSWVAVVVLALIVFLFVEAIRLVEVLAETRCRVLAGLGKHCLNPYGEWPGLKLFLGYVALHVLGRHPEKVKEIMARRYRTPPPPQA